MADFAQQWAQFLMGGPEVSPFARGIADMAYPVLKTAAIGGAAAGGKALMSKWNKPTKQSLIKAGFIKKSATTTMGRKSSAKRSVATVRPDGTRPGRFVAGPKSRKRKHRGKSLKKRLKALEKLVIPNMSFYRHSDIRPIKLNSDSANLLKIYDIGAFRNDHVETNLSDLNLTQVATTVDSKFLISGRYFAFEMKNAKTGNVKISWCFVQAQEATGKHYMADVITELNDRGYDVTGYVATTLNAPDATNSEVPQRYTISELAKYNPSWTIGKASHWKKLTNVSKTILGPGDTMTITKSFPDYTYKQEDQDEQGTIAFKNGDIRLLLRVEGTLGHGNFPDSQTDNTDLVQYSPYGLDCIQRNYFTIKYHGENPVNVQQMVSGLQVMAGTDKAVLHADNMVSGIEQTIEVP